MPIRTPATTPISGRIRAGHSRGRASGGDARSEGGPFGDGRDTLWGLPVSVKDCFDLAGAPTSCGVKFYRDLNGIASRDSWLVGAVASAGAVITGKTHLHPLAYGITGENPEFGDCLQPGKEGALTGGSSSGACASVLEGSAVAAIGTDTGGSVRVPAAFCGLAGYRASLGRGDWRGGAHLAESFDTMGWLFRDLEEAPCWAHFCVLASPPTFPHTPASPLSMTAFSTIASRKSSPATNKPSRTGSPWLARYHNRRSVVVGIFRNLRAHPGLGSGALHAGHFDQVQPAIRERLEWGACITPS